MAAVVMVEADAAVGSVAADTDAADTDAAVAAAAALPTTRILYGTALGRPPNIC